MDNNSLDGAFRNFSKQLVLVERTVSVLSGKLRNLSREEEVLKLDVLERALENKKVSQARRIGLAAMKKDNKNLIIGLATALGESLLQGAISKGNSVALGAGISSFNDFMQGLGDSRWAVSLDKQFIVIPEDKIFSGHVWVTWGSFHSAMKQLKQNVLGGDKLGDLDIVIDKLKHGRSKLVYLLIPVSEETHLGPWRPVTE
jgi:hypothetical protein